MKKLIYTAFVICGMLTASCSDLLNLESKTDVTNNYLFTTPEGLNTAVTGLYSLARELPGGADNNESNLYIVTMCDFNTDIAILRAGVSTSIGRLNTRFTPSTGDVNKFWKHHYGIIGKANEIIVAAEALGLDDSDVLHAWSEAKFFRGRSYFELWKRFDRLYLNVTPTTVDNLKREYKPASHEELMTLMTTDLDDAMKGLDWSLPQNNGNVLYGRVTKATAKHVRAQVAMWESDWDTAIEECEDIFKQEGIYSMEKKAENVFNSADLKSPEVLWSFQYSQNLGGGGSGTPVAGHRISIQTTTRINKIAGCINTADQGGYGWGRIYPNTYLLSLQPAAGLLHRKAGLCAGGRRLQPDRAAHPGPHHRGRTHAAGLPERGGYPPQHRCQNLRHPPERGDAPAAFQRQGHQLWHHVRQGCLQPGQGHRGDRQGSRRLPQKLSGRLPQCERLYGQDHRRRQGERLCIHPVRPPPGAAGAGKLQLQRAFQR